MAEAINNTYKTELIPQQDPCRMIKQVDLATLECVWWSNRERCRGELDMRTPIEVERASYAETDMLLSSIG